MVVDNLNCHRYWWTSPKFHLQIAKDQTISDPHVISIKPMEQNGSGARLAMQNKESEKNAPRAIIERIVHSRTFQTYLCVVPLGTRALLLGAFSLILQNKVWTCTRRSILGVILTAALLFPINWALGKTVNSGGSLWSLFLFNSSVGTGVIVETLDHYCPNTGWASCKLRQEFVEISKRPDPDWFLWKQSSPILRLGWFQNRDEPKTIIRHAFQCCLRRIIVGTLSGAWKQFWRIDSNEDVYPKTTRPVRDVIAIGLPGELAQFDASKEASHSSIYEGVKTMLFSNAMVCSFAGTLHARLQGRIAWLTVFCVLLGILTVVRKRPVGGDDGPPR